MTRLLSRFALLLAAAAAFAAGGAWAQVTITDGVTTKTTCTGYGLAATAGVTTITLTPNNCLTSVPTGTDPVFSVRLVPAATTQPSTGAVGVQTVLVFVDADKDVPTTTSYTLTLNLCTAAQNCTSSGSGNWYFFRYAELGGAGFTPQDAVTTGSYTFTFQPGAHTATNTTTTNMRSMGVGHMDVPNSPLFSGTRSVMLGLSGTNAATNVVVHTITGGQQVVGGTDLDINNNPIPAPTGPAGVQMVCNYPTYSAFNTPYPGSGPGPCGAYEIPVGNCSSGMTGTNAITRAWMYILEDYTPTSPRIGQAILAGIPRDQAMVFRFKTGAAGLFPQPYRNFGIGYSEQYTHGGSAPRFVTLSETKCDFDYTKTLLAGTLNGCVKTMSGDDSLLGKVWSSGSVPSPLSDYPYCPLKPDTTYYLNIRYENAGTISGRGVISCGGSQCGQAIKFD
jgi:hypothetical protein